MSKNFNVILLLIFLVGCINSAPQPYSENAELKTSAVSYQLGNLVNFELINNSGRTVFFQIIIR